MFMYMYCFPCSVPSGVSGQQCSLTQILVQQLSILYTKQPSILKWSLQHNLLCGPNPVYITAGQDPHTTNFDTNHQDIACICGLCWNNLAHNGLNKCSCWSNRIMCEFPRWIQTCLQDEQRLITALLCQFLLYKVAFSASFLFFVTLSIICEVSKNIPNTNQKLKTFTTFRSIIDSKDVQYMQFLVQHRSHMYQQFANLIKFMQVQFIDQLFHGFRH